MTLGISFLFWEKFALSISLTQSTHDMFCEWPQREALLFSSLPLRIPKKEDLGQSKDNDEILPCLL